MALFIFFIVPHSKQTTLKIYPLEFFSSIESRHHMNLTGSKVLRRAPKDGSLKLNDWNIKVGAYSIPYGNEKRDFWEGDWARDKNTSNLIKTSLYAKIHRMIDEVIYYPDEFKEAEIEGVVSGKLAFSKEGEFLPEASELKSVSRYLRVYVFRKIMNLFKKERGPIHKVGYTVNVFFDFQIKDQPSWIHRGVSPGELKKIEIKESSGKNQNNNGVLQFYREAIENNGLVLSVKEQTGKNLETTSVIDFIPIIKKAFSWMKGKKGPPKEGDLLYSYQRDPFW